jgi:hypothetical protein
MTEPFLIELRRISDMKNPEERFTMLQAFFERYKNQMETNSELERDLEEEFGGVFGGDRLEED